MTLPRGRLIRAGEATGAAARRADQLADAAALAIRARASLAEADSRALDRLVSLARLLAERLLGRALDLAPETIVALAHGVLAEARIARRVEIFVNPKHVTTLERATSAFDPEGRVHAITGDPSLSPGDVRIETELGTVVARIDGELGRLTHRLREALDS